MARKTKKKIAKAPGEKKHRGRKALLIVLLCLVLIAAVGFATAYFALERINRPDVNADYMTESELWEYDLAEAVQRETIAAGDDETEYPVMDDADVVFNPKNQVVASNRNVVNILLIGQDRRSGEGRQRSDAMILATFDKSDKTITLTSFLRDLYVQIPGYSNNRINAAYAFGGMDLLDETLELNFGVHVDGNLEVDFDQFTTIIDKLGGVDVDISGAEAEYLSLPAAGLVHMNGETALAYSRIRYLDSDFYRTERQRKVLRSVYASYKDSSLVDMVSIINDMLPLMTTDMTSLEIMGYAATLFPTIAAGNLETQRIPVDGSYTNATVNSMAVLVINFERNQDVVEQIVNGSGS